MRPPALEDLILALLAKDPRTRCASASSFSAWATVISSAIRAYSLKIDTRPWDTEMKPPSTATTSRPPPSSKITTALGTSTPSTGS